MSATVPTRRHLVALWLGAAAVLGAFLGFGQVARSDLDDPDPARQRPGFLDASPLPQLAPRIDADRPRPGRRMVAFFVRPGDVGPLCRRLQGEDFARRTDVVIVVAGTGACDAATIIDDRPARLARAYGLPAPRGGRGRVGYAIVDGDGNIRYRTLDPVIAGDISEVDTMLEAIS